MNTGILMISIPLSFYILFSVITGLLEQAWFAISILLGIGTILGVAVGTHVAASGITGESRKAAFIAATLSPVEVGLSAMVFAALPGIGFPADFSGIFIIFMNILYWVGILYLSNSASIGSD